MQAKLYANVDKLLPLYYQNMFYKLLLLFYIIVSDRGVDTFGNSRRNDKISQPDRRQ